MATQTTTSTEQQNQPTQGQVTTRGSQQQGALSRRRGYAPGLPFMPAEFFRMNPFSLMRRMTEELDRALTESTGREQGERTWSPAVDVTQREGNYMIRAEVPGVPPDAIKLEVMDDMIVIQGERKAEHEETRGGIHVTERRYGSFYRAIPLPEGAKPDEARARYENGVLEITVPTEEQRSKPREIPIQQGSQASQATMGTSAGNPGASSESAAGSGKSA
jgi:HSP20 family protein